MKKIMIQKITQNNWNFGTVNLIMRAKKLLTSRQIFRYAVPARTVTKKHCVGLGSGPGADIQGAIILHYHPRTACVISD